MPQIKLQTRIVLWISAILLLSGIVTMVLSVSTLLGNTDKAITLNLYNLAETVAKLPVVRNGIKGSPKTGIIQRQVMNILDSSMDVDYIVVCGMDNVRFSHPNPHLVGEEFVGGDETRILSGSDRYISTAVGTLGLSMRAFVPVFDYDGVTQLGFVSVGTLRSTIQNAQDKLVMSYSIFLFSGFIIGVAGAFFLSKSIKNSLLGLEPEDLAKLYREHKAMTEALHEGVVAVDTQGRITLLNESARNLLSLDGADANNMYMTEILPALRLQEIISTGEAEYDREQEVAGKVIISNKVPIKEKGRVVGAVATFRDKTLLIRLAEELTGARQLVEALRAGSHEFKNKLHTMLGLLELGEIDRAKAFVLDTQQKHEDLDNKLLSCFEDPVIAGVMFGKYAFCKERGVGITISPESRLRAVNDDGKGLSHILVTVIGNLVDNAVESASMNERRDGHVWVDVTQTDGHVCIRVGDNGTGIAAEDVSRIFERGFSTKGEGRGVGLFLVGQELEALGGCIDVSAEGGQTVFTACVPLERAEGGPCDTCPS